MTPIERALAKERLRLICAKERDEIVRHVAGLTPLFDVAERAHVAVRWVRRHPEAVGAGIVLAAILRPGGIRLLWRWGRRAFVAWRLWRRVADSAAGR